MVKYKRLSPSGVRPIPKDDGTSWDNGVYRVGLAKRNGARPWRLSSVVGLTGDAMKRFYLTRDDAIAEATSRTVIYEKAYYARHPDQKRSKTTGGSEPVKAHPLRKKKTPVFREKFSTTRFNCIYANPVAQVWQCVKESSNAGRKRRGHQPAHQTMTAHQINECMVLMGEEAVYTKTGQVRVFPNYDEAVEFALELYIKTPKSKRPLWAIGSPVIVELGKVQVLFQPDEDEYRPFKLWLPHLSKTVYYDKTRVMHTASGRSKNSAVQAAARIPSMTEIPLRFRNITAAMEEADRRNRMMQGETIVGLNDD